MIDNRFFVALKKGKVYSYEAVLPFMPFIPYHLYDELEEEDWICMRATITVEVRTTVKDEVQKPNLSVVPLETE